MQMHTCPHAMHHHGEGSHIGDIMPIDSICLNSSCHGSGMFLAENGLVSSFNWISYSSLRLPSP